MPTNGPPDGEDTLLALAREFEEHLNRLAEYHRLEQQRGDTLLAQNRLISERLGLKKLPPGDQEAGPAAPPAPLAPPAAAAPPPLAAQAEADEEAPASPVPAATAAAAAPRSAEEAQADAGLTLASSDKAKAGFEEAKLERPEKAPNDGGGSLTTPLLAEVPPASPFAIEQPPGAQIGRLQSVGSEASEVPSKASRARSREVYGTFYRNVAVALRMGFFCTVFGLPVCYQPAYDRFFGSLQCQESQLGRFVNKTALDGTHTLVQYTESFNHRWDPKVHPQDVWCGVVPKSFLAYWPNVIQTVIYTVYKSTGTTTEFAWHCMVGTFWATVNIYILMWIWPMGAREPTYNYIIAWLDLLVILFLFLISLSATNTLKFGMSWHVYFMMSFMNPNTGPGIGHFPTGIPGVQWDSEASAVLFTSAAGCLLAVLTMYVPYPMLNIARLEDDANNVSMMIDNIWAEAIEYFCGGARMAKRFQIEAKIMGLSPQMTGIRENLDASWWETFNLFQTGRKRSLYATLHSELNRVLQVMYTLKGCVVDEDFGGLHQKFCDRKMRASMIKLKNATTTVMRMSAIFAQDGYIDDDERSQLVKLVANVQHCQVELRRTYHENPAIREAEWISIDLLNENVFIFALSVWAYRVETYARENLIEKPRLKSTSRDSTCLDFLTAPLKETWDLEGMTAPAHRSFARRNFISIITCFCLGFFCKGSIFANGYQFQLANTLTLIISRFAGTQFEGSVKRLMGVALGKVLPILVMALVSLFDCDSFARFWAHAGVIFVYISVFEYMYFTSLNWSILGCLSAAFGCTFLYTPCSSDSFSSQFATRYEEIGQVIAAIMIQMFVDSALKSRSTREIAVDHVDTLGSCCQAGFGAFFNGETKIEDKLASMKEALDDATEFGPYTDPKMAVVPGPSIPMKGDLFALSINSMRLIVSDFSMMSMVTEGHVHKTLRDLPAWHGISTDFQDFLTLTFKALSQVLHHSTEDPINDDNVVRLEAMRNIMDIGGFEGLLVQLNQHPASGTPSEVEESNAIFWDLRVRLTVALKALQNARVHIATIAAGAIGSNIH